MDWFFDLLDMVFHYRDIGTPTGTFLFILSIINAAFVVFFAYRFIFTIIGFFHKKVTYPKSDKKYRIAGLIFARNEEKVLLNAINSMKAQDFNNGKNDIIVVANNCTDKTAEIAKNAGCIVYIRDNLDEQRKGYAMRYFFKKAKEDGLLDKYDGFVVLDADSIISRTYYSKINDCYATGKYEVITTYPDITNFDENFVSAAFGFNFYRMTMSCHRPKAVLGVGDTGCGTGWFISTNIIKKEGWDYVTLTEDAEFAVANIAKGYKFGFCEEAITYIEFPANFRISCRQRIRCAKGVLVDFVLYWGKLLWSFIKRPTFTKYDSLCEVFPYPLISFILTVSYQIFSLIYFLINPADNVNAWINFAIYIGTTIGGICVASWFVAILVTIREWKNIRAPLPKIILYALAFPWFDLLAIPLAFLSLFMHVTWKKIPHHSKKSNDTIDEELKSLNKQ